MDPKPTGRKPTGRKPTGRKPTGAKTTGAQPTGAKTTGGEPTATSVLKRINLTIADGEFLVLVGPSGCGKSTLLRLIAGLETLTAGKIWVGDRPVNDLPPKARDIAMVFQSYALYPHLSVYDNLAFGLRRGRAGSDAPGSPWQRGWQHLGFSLTRNLPPALRHIPPQERQIETQVRQVASLLQIEMLLDRLPRQLSGGQKQRVALGRAIARNPQVFLMDEPLSNLDAKLRAETRSQIVQLQRQLGTTTLYVTHDQVEAMTMGQRIAIMNQGQIQQVATPLELYRAPATRFVAEFIGSPPMNFIPVELKPPVTVVHHQFRFTLPEHWLPKVRPHHETTVLLGIRPEHFDLGSTAVKNLPVVVDSVEALGSDTYLTVHLLDSLEPLQVRAKPDQTFGVGQLLHLSVHIEQVHLFTSTGESIGHGQCDS
nr:ATP-binding cassette domain-containing protein [Prochlorothrix hollandica]